MAEQRVKGGGRKRKHRGRPNSTFVVSVVAIALLLTGGIIVALQSSGAAADEAAQAAAVAVSPSFYEEVSIQRVADVIENSDHSLVYFRSPT